MMVKENLNNINNDSNEVTKMHGRATIEFFDTKTGEKVEEKVEENMVTNYFQGPFSRELCGTYTKQPADLFGLIKGIQLLNHQEEEDASNVTMQMSVSNLTGFGTLAVNSDQTNTKYMSYNLLESGKTSTGYKWVWNANENQCNGPIECLSLITANLNESTLFSNRITAAPINQMFADGMMPLYLGKWVETEGNKNNTTFETGTFSNVVHIDWDNEILYDIERDYDNDKRIIIKRYNLNRNKINLRYRLKPTLLDEHEIVFQNSLNYDYGTSTIYARPFSAKIEGNILYLVKGGATTFSANTNLLRIIKIDLTNYTYTDEVKTLTQNFYDMYRQQEFGSAYGDSRRNFHFIKDRYPIQNGYVYLLSTGTTNLIYKINLNDISDVTEINIGVYALSSLQAASNYINLVTDENIFFYNRAASSSSYSKHAICISLENNEVSLVEIRGNIYHPYDTTGYYSTTSSYYTSFNNSRHIFADLKDGVLTMIHMVPFSTNSSNVYSGLTYIDQYAWEKCKVTINNVTPVVKTSDRTMKITYELSEATE